MPIYMNACNCQKQHHQQKPLLLANIQSLCQGESATPVLSMGLGELVQAASPRPREMPRGKMGAASGAIRSSVEGRAVIKSFLLASFLVDVYQPCKRSVQCQAGRQRLKQNVLKSGESHMACQG